MNGKACRNWLRIFFESVLFILAFFVRAVKVFELICLYFPGILAVTGTEISGAVYAWTAVLVLPINSALNPFLYTVTAILGKKVWQFSQCN